MSRPIVPLLLAATLAGGCRGESRTPRFPGAPVVLISIDTLRADHLPSYGYRAVDTPHLDRLRWDAILFENAYTHVPLTLPAHVSMLTGLLPPEHGVRDNLGYRFDAAQHPTLPQALKAKGYATGAAISAYVLRGGTGLEEAFDFYEDSIEAPAGLDAAGHVQRKGGETAALALQWMESVRDRPFFLLFHVYEPHSPFDPPEPFKSRHALAYDGEIAAADAIVGDFLDALRRQGIYDRAIVVLVSDHGEGLGDHGEEFHGILLYREALQVPLLLKLPGGLRAGTSVAKPVALVDLVPTLGSLLGVPVPQALAGRSLLEPAGAPRRIYAETYYPRIHLGWSDLRSLLDDRYHYIDAPKPELYDMTGDPGERKDILGSQGSVGRAMQKALADVTAPFTAPSAVSAEDREKLAALGYLGGAAPESSGPLPDPKDNIHLLDDVKAAFRLTAAGRDEEAVAAFRRILDKNRLFLDVQYELAQTLTRLGRYGEAYDAYKAALRSSPSLAGPIALAQSRICLELGKVDEAEANARLGLTANAGQGHELLARVALSRDDLPRAEAEARLAVGDPLAEANRVVILAEVHIRRDQLHEALAILDEGRQRLAQKKAAAPLRDLEFLRGDVLARLGRYADAEVAFKEEIRAFPRNSQAYARLAIVYGLRRRTLGDVDQLLRSMVAANPAPEACLLAAKTLESMGDPRAARAWRQRAIAIKGSGPRATH